jgi:hypothetical protein
MRCGVLMGRPEGKRPLGRPRRRWEDNIKTYLQEVEWEGMDWIALAQDRDRWRAVEYAVMNLRVSMKCEEFLGLALLLGVISPVQAC